MSFSQISAPHGQRTDALLSADNGTPERHIVLDVLRMAAPRLGLTAPVLATLDAMLSCLPPKRSHHTVFASNKTLAFRLNGVSDRTVRRHAALLQEAGLLIRRDSPNKKRYARHSATEGKAIRFGFDLRPLFDRLAEFAALAAEAQREKEQIAYLRCKIRIAANDLLLADPENAPALAAKRAMRRKLTVAEYETVLAALPAPDTLAETDADPCETPPLSASDSQSVRHDHKSKKELIDKKAAPCPEPSQDITVPDLLTACPEPAQFSLRKVTSRQDVIDHGRAMAPMIGIDPRTYQSAQDRLGPYGAAVTVWAILQAQGSIKQAGAYFRSVTIGAKSAGFDPARWVRRLALAAPQAV